MSPRKPPLWVEAPSGVWHALRCDPNEAFGASGAYLDQVPLCGPLSFGPAGPVVPASYPITMRKCKSCVRSIELAAVR